MANPGRKLRRALERDLKRRDGKEVSGSPLYRTVKGHPLVTGWSEDDNPLRKNNLGRKIE